MDQDGVDLFEEAIAEAMQRVQIPLITLQQQNEKDDPQEELIELL